MTSQEFCWFCKQRPVGPTSKYTNNLGSTPNAMYCSRIYMAQFYPHLKMMLKFECLNFAIEIFPLCFNCLTACLDLNKVCLVQKVVNFKLALFVTLKTNLKYINKIIKRHWSQPLNSEKLLTSIGSDQEPNPINPINKFHQYKIKF